MDAQAHILRDLLAQIASKEAEEEGAENGFAGEFLVSNKQNMLKKIRSQMFRFTSCDSA